MTVTEVPAKPSEGVKPVMVGGAALVPITKLAEETAVPFVLETEIGPVVAAEGTVTRRAVALAAVTAAATPLNATELALAVVLKPLPKIVTLVPARPPLGEKLAIASVFAVLPLTAVMLPTASYAYWVLVPSGATTCMRRPRSS
ncbi:hypothetical protein POZ19_20150 [Ralstonia wenshanensis]